MRALVLLLAFCPLLGLSCSAQPHVETRVADPPKAEAEPIACGDLTCGPTERCVVQCECCGIPVPPEELRASFRCEPMPVECGSEPDPLLDCRRLVEHPCP